MDLYDYFVHVPTTPIIIPFTLKAMASSDLQNSSRSPALLLPPLHSVTGNSSGGVTVGVGANAVSDGIVEGFGGGGGKVQLQRLQERCMSISATSQLASDITRI